MLRLLLLLMPLPAMAESLVAARNLPARSTITSADVVIVPAEITGALASADLAIGQETRVAIYVGRPVRAADLGPATLVERNARVTLAYRRSGLTLVTEGRALARGGLGDEIPVLNLSSKVTVTGRITPDGQILVGGDP